MSDTTLVVGLGSPHGDDQVGWLIADAMAGLDLPGVTVRRAAAPVDLLDWLAGVERLILCDGSRGDAEAGTVRSWTWPDPQIRGVKFGGTHDLGLASVLELAEQLGTLPESVRIWTIEIAGCQPGEEVSLMVARHVPLVVGEIRAELGLR